MPSVSDGDAVAKEATMSEYFIRMMATTDLVQVTDIEFDSFMHPWGLAEFSDRLGMMRSIELVALPRPRSGGPACLPVLGYVVFKQRGSTVHIENLAVDPDHRRRGVARALIDFVCSPVRDPAQLASDRRTRITRIRTRVSEYSAVGQMFFRSMGFRAVKIEKNAYEDYPGDAYVFVYRAAAAASVEVMGQVTGDRG
jgi:ribosomal-protein-alanine N-acetyltransferase